MYRVAPRSTLPAADKVADDWADANTAIVREYRAGACAVTATETCAAFQSAFAALADFTSAADHLVVDGLTLTDAAGAAIAPFESSGGTITLRMQFASRARG